MRLINIKGYLRKGRFIRSSQRKLLKAKVNNPPKLISKSTYQIDDAIEKRILDQMDEDYFLPSLRNPSKLSVAEQYAISEYSGSSYYNINKSLRGTKTSKSLQQDLQDQINAIRSGLNKLPPTTSKEVYRGLRTNNPAKINEIYKQYEVDQIITEPGFLSTSPVDRNQFGNLIKFKIRPKPTTTKGKVLGDYSQMPDENEVLFPPSTSFKVKNKYQEGKTKWIELEEL